MKKCILIAVSIAMIIILSACNSKTEYNYSESDKTLAKDIYTFANEKYKEEDNVYLMAICLFPTETGGFLEFVYSTKPLYSNSNQNEPFGSLGFTTSYCYEIKDSKIIDDKIDTSLGGILGSKNKMMWFQDDGKDKKCDALLEMARIINNTESQNE